MSAILQEIREKINLLVADQSFFTASLLVLVALASFGLGRQSVVVKEQVKTLEMEAKPVVPIVPEETVQESGTFYVASKNGSVYHLPYCSGAKRINEENKITFKTKEEAEAAGLRPAANCPGI